jgi:hypothetical protein
MTNAEFGDDGENALEFGGSETGGEDALNWYRVTRAP